MSVAVDVVYWVAGLVVLAEALNKLDRTAPFAPGLSSHARLVSGLKALAWALLAFGGGGAFAGPLMAFAGLHGALVQRLCSPGLHDAAVMLGFAVLIVRTRVKEG